MRFLFIIQFLKFRMFCLQIIMSMSGLIIHRIKLKQEFTYVLQIYGWPIRNNMEKKVQSESA